MQISDIASTVCVVVTREMERKTKKERGKETKDGVGICSWWWALLIAIQWASNSDRHINNYNEKTKLQLFQFPSLGITSQLCQLQRFFTTLCGRCQVCRAFRGVSATINYSDNRTVASVNRFDSPAVASSR